jgi:NitT/TauT family transport system substrate-binding protein
MKKMIVILAIVALVAFSGCVEQPETIDEGTTEGETVGNETTGEDGAITHLRIGYQPSTHQIAHMIAMENGWWKSDLAEFGVSEVSDHQFASGPPEMTAMMGGHLDIAYVGAAPPITAIAQGLNAKIVAGVQTQGSDLVLRHEVNYTSPSDLSGLKIATFPSGSIQDTVFKKFLTDNGVAIEDVEIVPLGPADAISAIATDAVDGVFLPHPGPAVIELAGNGRSVVNSSEMWQGHACCCLVVSDELIESNPAMVKQIIRTHIRATTYLNENQNESAQIFADKIGYDIDTVKHSFETWDGEWITDPHLELDDALEYATVIHELGYIDEPLTAEDLFDTSFYDEVSGE